MKKTCIISFMLVFILSSLLLITGCSEEKKDGDMRKHSVVYYCPMHPEVTSDKPGVCPICHMDLVKKNEENPEMEETMEGTISLSSNKYILANVSTVKVTKEHLKKTISAYSYLDFAEENRKLITARFNGRIEKLFIANTGDFVRKGDPLFEIYSPDLVQAQNDYLLALRQTPAVVPILNSDISNREEKSLLESARRKLLLFGISENQIEELKSAGEVKLTMQYNSPVNGTVIEKKALEGMYVNEGSVIYDIADMSVLWNIAEVYADDLSLIKEGSSVKLKLQSYPEETFTGKVSLIYPVVNPETRTIKVRSVFSDKKLKPNMYGETIFEADIGEALAVPEDAVLFTGERNLVYVKVEEGKFEPRDVKLGQKAEGKYQVISGLMAAEEIVSSGGYLIDSESQLRSGTSQVHQHGNTDVEKDTDHPTHSENTGKDEKSIIRDKNIKVSSVDINKDGKVFQCPMDFEVISDKLDACPLCGMDLEEFTIAEAQKNLAD